jgi:hypothetical protein
MLFNSNAITEGKMKPIYLAALLVCLVTPSQLLAQGAKSPQDLANQVKQLVVTKKTDKIKEFIAPGASAESVLRFQGFLSKLKNNQKLQVYAVPKDDQAAVKKAGKDFLGQYQPLDARLKNYAKAGKKFTLQPQGDIVIIGELNGGSPKGNIGAVVYGKDKGNYLITFAK